MRHWATHYAAQQNFLFFLRIIAFPIFFCHSFDNVYNVIFICIIIETIILRPVCRGTDTSKVSIRIGPPSIDLDNDNAITSEALNTRLLKILLAVSYSIYP